MSAPRPRRVAMVVANGVHGDSRVQRVAAAAADGGWSVLVIGRTDGSTVARSRLRTTGGAVDVLLVPVPAVLGVGGPAGALRRRNHPDVRAARRLLAERDRLAGHPPGGRLIGRLRFGAWRLTDPWVQDLELAMAPHLEDFAPDLVHAHDRQTIALAARSAAALRHHGRPTRWVLDAHEYVAATAARGAGGLRGRVRRAMVVGQQSEFIAEADAVVTVSSELARMLAADHHLPASPTVVLNAPDTDHPDTNQPGAEPGPEIPSLRTRLGLSPEVPLLVYVGGCAPARGVSTAVDALQHLPGHHLALVAAPDDADADALLAKAEEAGTGDRVHRVDYVPSHQVTALLRDADIGLVPLLHRPNHEISLVTKYLEYLHAGLPVVVSQVRAMAAFTSEHRVGEVYATGDPRALAEAVSTVMANRDRYAHAVATDPAVAATAWSRQAEVLGDLYDRLVPAPDYPGDR